jgi:type IV secretory pathway TrbD component
MAELSAVVPVTALGLIAWRTGALPRGWAIYSFALAAVLVIGPIGWAGLMFGVPIWMLGTSFLVSRRHSVAMTYTTPSITTT